MNQRIINPNDPDYWPNLRARFLAEKIAHLTQEHVNAFDVAAKKVRPGMIYEAYVSNIAHEATVHYHALIEAVGRPEAFDKETKTAFMKACADRCGLPEIAGSHNEIHAEAGEAVKDAHDSLYGAGPDY